MATVRIDGSDLVVTIHGVRRVLTLKGELRVPLQHVTGATVDTTVADDYPKALQKRVGANIPHVYYGGTFVQDGDRVFWDVHHPDRVIEVNLSDEDFARLVIEVDDPAASVDLIRSALAAR